MLLHPPKHDWIKFRDFSLAEIWDAVEVAEFGGGAIPQNPGLELAEPRLPHAKDGSYGHAHAHYYSRGPGLVDVKSPHYPGVFHFRPSVLANHCPGVRCDGLHFGSDFEGWVCARSHALWDHYLAHFLVRAATQSS